MTGPSRTHGRCLLDRPVKPGDDSIVGVRLIGKCFKLGAAVLIAAPLGGCATSLNVVGDPFVAPAKFQFLRCEDIAKRLATAQTRERELRDLMDRANTGVGGSAVNILVYEPDLQTVQSELRQLRATAVEKQCPDEAAKTVAKPDTAKQR